MIYNNIEDANITLEFGTGDISVVSGYNDELNKVRGIVGFRNQEPREIGKQVDIEEGLAIEDFLIVMRFNKVESIDVIIKALQEAKDNMLCMNRREEIYERMDTK